MNKKLLITFIIILLAVPLVTFLTIAPLQVISTPNPNAGTWEDDAGNWQRAFQSEVPDDLIVIHSYYWMSDHFTTEYLYYFEIKPSAQWREDFFKKRKLVKIDAATARISNFNANSRPAWFLPETVESYDVWDIKGYSGSVFINKKTGHLFFYGFQV
jgi:hypothetical protein